MEKLYGLYAGKILSYNSAKKTAQVSVEPYTKGAENGITAKLAYPVGFDDQDTELSINGQPDIWVFFEKGSLKIRLSHFLEQDNLVACLKFSG